MNLNVTQELIKTLASGFLPLLAYSFSLTKRSIQSHLIVVCLLLSMSFDLANLSLWMKKENNLHFINLYDYIALILEMGLMLSIVKFKRGFVIFTVVLVLTYLLLHGIFNYRYGFSVMSTFLSFAFSLIICVYTSIVSFKILSGNLKKFNESRHMLIPILGFFIFEASCLIPMCTVNLKLGQEEGLFLADLYNQVISVGSILRNILFTAYFIVEYRLIKKSLRSRLSF